MSVQGKLATAVVGTGEVGSVYARHFREHAEAKLKAVCDSRAELARKVADECGCKCYTDMRSLLAEEQLDLVLIAMPGHSHKRPAMLAAEAGIKGIICESPLAANTKDAREILLAAKSSGAHLWVLYPDRFLPFFRTIKLALEMGVLGEPVYADLKLDSNISELISFRDELGPGRLSSPACLLLNRVVDLVCWWFAPARVERVMGIKQSRDLLGSADLYDSFLLFDSGLKVRVKSECTRSMRISRQFVVTITGTQGGINCTESGGFAPKPGLRFEFHKSGNVQKVIKFRERLVQRGITSRLVVGKGTPGIAIIEVPLDENAAGSFRLLDHYVHCLRTGKEAAGDVPGPGSNLDGWEQVRILEAIEEGTRNQAVVKLGEASLDQTQASLQVLKG